MPFAAFVLAYLGFAGLALAMPRHYQQVAGRPLPPGSGHAFRLGGWAVLAASSVPCILHWNTALGITAWLGVLSLAAVSVALTLTCRVTSNVVTR